MNRRAKIAKETQPLALRLPARARARRLGMRGTSFRNAPPIALSIDACRGEIAQPRKTPLFMCAQNVLSMMPQNPVAPGVRGNRDENVRRFLKTLCNFQRARLSREEKRGNEPPLGGAARRSPNFPAFCHKPARKTLRAVACAKTKKRFFVSSSCFFSHRQSFHSSKI